MIPKILQSKMNQEHCSIIKSSGTQIFTIMSYSPEFRLYDTLIKMTFFLMTPQTTQIFCTSCEITRRRKEPLAVIWPWHLVNKAIITNTNV